MGFLSEHEQSKVTKGLAAIPAIAALSVIEVGVKCGIAPFAMAAAISRQMASSLAAATASASDTLHDYFTDPQATWAKFQKKKAIDTEYQSSWRVLHNAGLLNSDGWVGGKEPNVGGLPSALQRAVARFRAAETAAKEAGIIKSDVEKDNWFQKLDHNPIRRKIQSLTAEMHEAASVLKEKVSGISMPTMPKIPLLTTLPNFEDVRDVAEFTRSDISESVKQMIQETQSIGINGLQYDGGKLLPSRLLKKRDDIKPFEEMSADELKSIRDQMLTDGKITEAQHQKISDQWVYEQASHRLKTDEEMTEEYLLLRSELETQGIIQNGQYEPVSDTINRYKSDPILKEAFWRFDALQGHMHATGLLTEKITRNPVDCVKPMAAKAPSQAPRQVPDQQAKTPRKSATDGAAALKEAMDVLMASKHADPQVSAALTTLLGAVSQLAAQAPEAGPAVSTVEEVAKEMGAEAVPQKAAKVKSA